MEKEGENKSEELEQLESESTEDSGDDKGDERDDEGEATGDGTEGEGDEGEGDESGEGESEGEDLEEITGRLAALEDSTKEKDAEITWLRNQLASRRETEPKGGERGEQDGEFNLDDIAKRLVDKDPRSAAKVIIEIAQKIADQRAADAVKRSSGMIESTRRVEAAKLEDRNNIMADYGEYLDDPEFQSTMERVYDGLTNNKKNYIPDAGYAAASTAARLIDRKRAAKNGKRNGVKEVRREAPNNPVEPDTHDYKKIKTINGIPDKFLKPDEKRAALAAVKKMGIKESEWVDAFKEQNMGS